MKKIYILFLSLVVMSSSINAQSGEAQRAYRKAKKYYKKSDFLRAIPHLKEAVNLDPENANYCFKLGRAYFEGSDQRTALPYLVRAYNNDRNIDPRLNYYLSRSLHMNAKYEEALTHYQADLNRYDPDTKEYKDTEMRIMQAKNGMKADPTVAQVSVDNLGEYINTRYPEYSSTFAQDYTYMIYTSRRPRDTRTKVLGINHIEDINEEVYEAHLVGDNWMKSRLFSKPIPVWTHDASVAITEDGKTLVYYEDKNYGDIYISRNENGKWSKKESIGDMINTKFNEPSIFITADGNTLYYVSDKPGGTGMKDLYVSSKGADGEWEEGKSIGDHINTEYDEDAPFISPNGKKLYFSSRGHTSIGGYDIFVCDKLPDGSWSVPKNLGYPYNSPGEDIYYVALDNDEQMFYFSSDRPGGFGNMDIYEGSPYTSDDFPTSIAGIVTDERTGNPIEADVNLVNPYTNEIVETVRTVDGVGAYNFNLPDCGVKYKLDVVVPSKEIPVSPGPDKIGAANVIAGTVIDDVTRLPVSALVEMLDPVSGDVIDKVYSNPKTGNYLMPIESGRPYMLRVKSNEYLPYYEEFNVSPTGEVEAHQMEIGLQKQREMNKLVITWQFFDHDKDVIKRDYQADLENVKHVLEKIPSIKLKVVGHTDSDGTDKYNQDLSIRRANRVADYLIANGIPKERLIISGEGEKMPLYDNADANKKKWNRRVELYIVN